MLPALIDKADVAVVIGRFQVQDRFATLRSQGTDDSVYVSSCNRRTY